MDLAVWHIWIIVAILLLIAEIFTTGFLTATLAMGCLAAGFFAYLDFGIGIQLTAFSVFTLIGFFGIRPFMLKYAQRENAQIKTNTDALIGKIGKVTEAIDNRSSQGRVIVDGEDWRAETEADEIVDPGEKVQILRVNSTKLIVQPLKKSKPWGFP